VIYQKTVAGGGVQIKKAFLNILTVIALISGESEHALLEDGIIPIPERKRQAQTLLIIAYTSQAVFTPAIGAGTGLVVVEIFPGLTGGAVILPNCSPGAFAQVGTPQSPVIFTCASLL
jgi:hypothetical protein